MMIKWNKKHDKRKVPWINNAASPMNPKNKPKNTVKNETKKK